MRSNTQERRNKSATQGALKSIGALTRFLETLFAAGIAGRCPSQRLFYHHCQRLWKPLFKVLEPVVHLPRDLVAGEDHLQDMLPLDSGSKVDGADLDAAVLVWNAIIESACLQLRLI